MLLEVLDKPATQVGNPTEGAFEDLRILAPGRHIVAVVSLERHRLRFVAGFGLGAAQPVQLAVAGEDPAAGSGTEVNPELLQGGTDPELTQFWVPLELADRLHRSEVGLDAPLAPRMGFVLEAAHALVNPAAEGLTHPPSDRLQIPGDAGDVPSLSVEVHDHAAPLDRISDLGMGQETSEDLGGWRLLRQDLLDRV